MCIEHVFRKCYNYRLNRHIEPLIRTFLEFISVLMHTSIYIDLLILYAFNQFPQNFKFVNGISSNLGMTKAIRVDIVFHRSATIHRNRSV